jgi:hypothetical protein
LCSITTALAATVVIPAAAIQGDTERVSVLELPPTTIIATGGEVSAVVAVFTGDDVLQRAQTTKQLAHRKVLSSVITFATQAPIQLLAATVAIAVAK